MSVRRVLHQSASVEFKKTSVFGVKIFIGHLILTMITAQTLLFVFLEIAKNLFFPKFFIITNQSRKLERIP